MEIECNVKYKEEKMKTVRIIMCVMVMGVVSCLVSCGKETPANKIENTTNALENKIEGLQKEVEEKKTEEVVK
jgi:hypothetical protein